MRINSYATCVCSAGVLADTVDPNTYPPEGGRYKTRSNYVVSETNMR